MSDLPKVTELHTLSTVGLHGERVDIWRINATCVCGWTFVREGTDRILVRCLCGRSWSVGPPIPHEPIVMQPPVEVRNLPTCPSCGSRDVELGRHKCSFCRTGQT